ncbi:transcriptional regulator, LysR family [Cribrihabitans marinus]|uniref:Transcriptional regulator, LysR family n=1 Tax=Cribrihabitans marinus TaxID=1227549 RepID=A0A1H6VF42_9RHOB|nr:hydrogen peroxide-inducible genes activator [Cribrihabitans marinus]GGH25947.1 hyaluronan synthase [Cribrihabitans marinus]SEJ02426.1 transcriptional regulator, LysR family [Cribrihabitans marinus]
MSAEITLRQIRYFDTLARAGQYRRAARQLGISQPSLSLQISALEETLGQRLVERHRNGLILTPEGRDAAAQAERVLREVEALAQQASPLRGGLRGTLRLGSTPTIGPYLLPRVLQRLHAAHPELRLVVRDGAPRELIEDLAAGAHDMVLTHLPVRGDSFRVQPLFREPLHLAVAPGHPLAGSKRIDRADLRGLPMLSLGPAYTLHRQVADLCDETGAVLRSDFEGTSLDALRQMVSMNMGVTLLPGLYVRSEVEARGGDVSVMPLRGMHRSIGLAWRAASGTPRAFADFAALIGAVVREEFAGVVIAQG